MDKYGDEAYYMKRLAEILDSYPQHDPPKGHPTLLFDNVLIGNQDNADDSRLLACLEITHVLNCAGTRTFDLTRSPYKLDVGIKSFLMIPAQDYDEYNIAQHFNNAFDFLDKTKKEAGKVLIHCSIGVNRSGAICAAYWMHSHKKKLLEVAVELKAKRLLILCNKGFRKQLIKFARKKGILDPMGICSSKIIAKDEIVNENSLIKCEKFISAEIDNCENNSNNVDISKREIKEKSENKSNSLEKKSDKIKKKSKTAPLKFTSKSDIKETPSMSFKEIVEDLKELNFVANANFATDFNSLSNMSPDAMSLINPLDDKKITNSINNIEATKMIFMNEINQINSENENACKPTALINTENKLVLENEKPTPTDNKIIKVEVCPDLGINNSNKNLRNLKQCEEKKNQKTLVIMNNPITDKKIDVNDKMNTNNNSINTNEDINEDINFNMGESYKKIDRKYEVISELELINTNKFEEYNSKQIDSNEEIQTIIKKYELIKLNSPYNNSNNYIKNKAKIYSKPSSSFYTNAQTKYMKNKLLDEEIEKYLNSNLATNNYLNDKYDARKYNNNIYVRDFPSVSINISKEDEKLIWGNSLEKTYIYNNSDLDLHSELNKHFISGHCSPYFSINKKWKGKIFNDKK